MGISVMSAGTGGATSGSVVLSNSNGFSFGMSNSSIVTAIFSQQQSYIQMLKGNVLGNSTFPTTFQSTGMSIFPLMGGHEAKIPSIVANTLFMQLSCSSSQSTASGTFYASLGLYTLNASTLSLANSVATSITWAAVSNNSTAFSGQRWLTIHSSQWSTTPIFSQTQWWLGLIFSSSNATQGFVLMGNQFVSPNTINGTIGVATATGDHVHYPFWGTKNTSAFPVSLITSDVVRPLGVDTAYYVPMIALVGNIPAF